jgi:hypothetical protein
MGRPCPERQSPSPGFGILKLFFLLKKKIKENKQLGTSSSSATKPQAAENSRREAPPTLPCLHNNVLLLFFKFLLVASCLAGDQPTLKPHKERSVAEHIISCLTFTR